MGMEVIASLELMLASLEWMVNGASAGLPNLKIAPLCQRGNCVAQRLNATDGHDHFSNETTWLLNVHSESASL